MTPGIRQASGLRVTHRTDFGEADLVALDVLAREAGLRRAVVSRFVALGLLEPAGGTPERPLFARNAAALVAAAARLRRDLGLNYAGAALACELLARIERLEQRLEAASNVDDGQGAGRR
jgi:hypothetical protein